MMTTRTELPLLAILDLDQKPSVHQFYARNDKNKLPQAGKDIRMLPDALPMINTFKARGIKIAIASKIGSKKLAMHLLDSFQILDKIDYIEIYPNEKTVHIKSIQAKSGVPFQRMILFDDLRDGRYGNCVLLSAAHLVWSVFIVLMESGRRLYEEDLSNIVGGFQVRLGPWVVQWLKKMKA